MLDEAFLRKMIGTTLGGRYRLERALGGGGFGTVFTANDRALDRTVAVKILGPQAQMRESAVKRFEREARILGKLRHPNIVQVIDFAREGEMMYIAMELVPGKTLIDVVAERFPMQSNRMVNILEHILKALEEAHALGVIHRDLKPENIIVEVQRDGTEVAKVLDFGIAMLTESNEPRVTREGAVAGTPEYMSPEQCRDQRLDGRSDLYAVGCLIYLMLCGRPPFLAPSPIDIVMGHLFHEPVKPSERMGRDAISTPLENAALWCLAKRADERPRSARELREELGRAFEQKPLPTDRLNGTSERNRLAAARSVGTQQVELEEPTLEGSILVIEPPSASQELLVEAIRAMGATALPLPSLSSAIDLKAFDCVLLGSAVRDWQSLLEQRLAPALPTLVFGSEDDLDGMTRALELGAFEFVPLPLNPLGLRRSLRRAVRTGRRSHAQP